MQFSSFAEFVNMGGHGFYVWLSYGVSIALLGLLVFFSVKKHNDAIKQIQLKQIREAKLKRASQNIANYSSEEVNHESTS